MTPLLKYSIIVCLPLMVISCGPIMINYIPIKSSNNTKISLFHYPNNKLKSNVIFSFSNKTNDTIWFDENLWLRVNTNNNLIDSSQLLDSIRNLRLKFLSPNNNIDFDFYYWAKTFKGSLKEFKKSVINDEITFFIFYNRKGGYLLSDTMTLNPDKNKIIKW